jgi:hypothetical protein
MADVSYWKGKVGHAQIYMELDCEPSKVEAKAYKECENAGIRYFYRSSLVDIMLTEPNKDKTSSYEIKVQKTDYDDKVQEEFKLHYHKDKLYGIWKNQKKKLDVQLTRIPNLKDWEDFTKLRESFYRYKRDKIVKFKANKELVLIREKYSNTLLFRLGNRFLSQSRNALNPILDKIQKKSSTFVLECVSALTYGSGVEQISGDIEYLSSNLLGYIEKSSYYCGGAHPDFYVIHQLYDLHTGKVYQLDDLIDFDKIPLKDKNSSDEIDTIKAKKLRWLGFKAKNIPLKPNKKQEEEMGYDPYDLIFWQYIEWAYEKDGIRIYLNFPAYLRCYRGDKDESFFIPFEMLQQYKNNKFPYPFGK